MRVGVAMPVVVQVEAVVIVVEEVEVRFESVIKIIRLQTV